MCFQHTTSSPLLLHLLRHLPVEAGRFYGWLASYRGGGKLHAKKTGFKLKALLWDMPFFTNEFLKPGVLSSWVKMGSACTGPTSVRNTVRDPLKSDARPIPTVIHPVV